MKSCRRVTNPAPQHRPSILHFAPRISSAFTAVNSIAK